MLSPISYGLRRIRLRGLGRLRGLLGDPPNGPARLRSLVGGLVALVFALAVRLGPGGALRRDLAIAPGRFAILDRRGRRDFKDHEVQALAFRARSAAAGTVSTQRGRAVALG